MMMNRDTTIDIDTTINVGMKSDEDMTIGRGAMHRVPTRLSSLYIHVPFCVRKCDYCAFYSHSLVNSPKNLIVVYLEGLEVEMTKRCEGALQEVASLFIGGGTPTALQDRDLERLMEMIQHHFRLKPSAERTIEGNPGTITAAKLAILRRFGINRFSLGVQAFDDKLLSAVGRMHTAQEAREAIERLRTAGFDNLNLDLMFGLPTQDMAMWQASVEEALSYSPEHLSLYGLMLEEGTPLYERYKEGLNDGSDQTEKIKIDFQLRGGPTGTIQGDWLPDDDLQAEMQEWAVQRLKQAGYSQYETSNFARSGYECQHNLGYWRGEDYLGFGPGGVSCLNRVRWKNVEEVRVYQSRLQNGQDLCEEAGKEALTLNECMAERMILGLRLQEGVSLTSFRNDFGVDLRDIYRDILERYKYKDIFRFMGDYLSINPKFSFVANSILQEFV